MLLSFVVNLKTEKLYGQTVERITGINIWKVLKLMKQIKASDLLPFAWKSVVC